MPAIPADGHTLVIVATLLTFRDSSSRTWSPGCRSYCPAVRVSTGRPEDSPASLPEILLLTTVRFNTRRAASAVDSAARSKSVV